MIKKIKVFLPVLVLMITVAINAVPIQAEENVEKLSGVWSVDAEGAKGSIYNDGESTFFKFDTREETQDFVSTQIDFKSDRNLKVKSRSGICLTIQNNSYVPVELTFGIKDKNNQNFMTQTGDTIIQVEDGTSMSTRLSEYGGYVIPNLTAVTIIIPIDALRDAQETEQQITDFSQFFIMCTAQKGYECRLQISELSYITNANERVIPSYMDSYITGEKVINVPFQGEYEYQYMIANDMGYTFREESVSPGITLNKDGKLVVTNQAQRGKISITAVNDAGHELVYQIMIEENPQEAIDIHFFASPEEIKRIPSIYQEIYNEKVMTVVVVILSVVSLIVLILCIWGIKKNYKPRNDIEGGI